MIKKVAIKKYGPFEDVEVNFVNGSEPIYIIGMNDVGKTALLTSIDSLSSALSGKYYRENKSHVIITWKIVDNFYSQKLTESFKNNFNNVEIYYGEIEIVRDINFKSNFLNKNLFTRDSNFKIFIDKILKEINEMLSMNNKFDISEISQDDLENLIAKIKNKSRKTQKDDLAINRIEVFINYKNEIYEILNKVKYLPADQNNQFDFIKDEYLLFDKINDAGQKINSDMHHLEKIMKSFITNDKYKSFKETLFSDQDEVIKNGKLATYSRTMEKAMNKFFLKSFPSENKEIEFSMRKDGNYLYWTVKDKSYNEFKPLSKRSDGFQWFIKLYTFTSSIKNGNIIVIDEPEKFLHASAQESLVNLFHNIKKEKKIQIIYATHSPFMLSNSVFTNVKIVKKTNQGSKIYNNVNAFVNDNTNDFQDALLPISIAMSLPPFALVALKDWVNKTMIFVEGEADISTIRIGEHLKGSSLQNVFIWPLLGDKKFYSISMAISLKINYFILFDGPRREINNDFPNDQTLFLQEIIGQNNPEDILSKETLQEYNINQTTNEGKLITNHKIGWKALYDDIINKNFVLKKEETILLKKYIESINKYLKDNS